VLLTFTRPVCARLSPEVWSDMYQTRANCRTILIDLLQGDGRAKPIPQTAVSYKITVEKQ
jgi:hypothetical protein